MRRPSIVIAVPGPRSAGETTMRSISDRNPWAAEAAIADVGAGGVIAMHPNIAEEYRRSIADLRQLLDGTDEESRRAAQGLRSLIDRIVVSPADRGPGTAITIEGRLMALLNLTGGGPVSQPVCQRWCPGEDSNLHALASAST